MAALSNDCAAALRANAVCFLFSREHHEATFRIALPRDAALADKGRDETMRAEMVRRWRWSEGASTHY